MSESEGGGGSKSATNTRSTTPHPGQPTPEGFDGETVWVARGRNGALAKIHTYEDCRQLNRANAAVPRAREKQETELGRELCSTCDRRERKARGEDVSDGRNESREQECPLGCGETVSYLARHLPECDGPSDEDRGAVECETCGESFDSARAKNSHHYHAHGELAPSVMTTCRVCDRRFHPHGDTEGMYCSIKCLSKSKIQFVEITCEECGRSKRVKPHLAGRKYCSRQCAYDAERERVTFACEWCGGPKEVPPSKADRPFCSPQCDQDWRRFLVYRGVRVE